MRVGVAHLWCVSILTSIHAPLTAGVAAVGVYPNLNGVGGWATEDRHRRAHDDRACGGRADDCHLRGGLGASVIARHYQTASKARTGLLVAVAAAALDGTGIAWLNFLLNIGHTL